MTKEIAFLHTARTDDRACPVCARLLDAATGVSLDAKDRAPQLSIDDLTCCAYCRTILVVTTLGFRVATAAEIDAIDPKLRQLLLAFVQEGGARHD